jgi:hypothetical protein
MKGVMKATRTFWNADTTEETMNNWYLHIMSKKLFNGIAKQQFFIKHKTKGCLLVWGLYRTYMGSHSCTNSRSCMDVRWVGQWHVLRDPIAWASISVNVCIHKSISRCCASDYLIAQLSARVCLPIPWTRATCQNQVHAQYIDSRV